MGSYINIGHKQTINTKSKEFSSKGERLGWTPIGEYKTTPLKTLLLRNERVVLSTRSATKNIVEAQ